MTTRTRDIRKRLGKTQAEVARLAGIERSAYSRIEAGQRSPMVNNALKIATALGTSVEALFGGDELDDTADRQSAGVNSRPAAPCG